jgi:predicted kinase
MRRKESLEQVGEREEADPHKETHVRAVLAAFDRSGSGDQIRYIRRQLPSEFDHLAR